MREICTSGSMSGRWKRGMATLVRHRQTKEPVTDRRRLNHRATSRLYRSTSHRRSCIAARPPIGSVCNATPRRSGSWAAPRERCSPARLRTPRGSAPPAPAAARSGPRAKAPSPPLRAGTAAQCRPGPDALGEIGGCGDPVAERAAAEQDPVPREDVLLPVQRRVIAVLREHDLRQQSRSGEALLHRL